MEINLKKKIQKILIIGHTGFIGKKIYGLLSDNKNYIISGISNNEINLLEERSNSKLVDYFSSDSIVIMCAGVKKQLGDNLESLENNILIINNFIRAISKKHPKKIIYFSSAAVYGEDINFIDKITENTLVQPRTYYGIAKSTSELMLKKICAKINTSLLILRPPLVYGDGDFSYSYGPTGFIYKAINSEDLVLWGDGSEFREFIYVDDIAKVIDLLIKNNFNGILNIASGQSYTFKQITKLLKVIVNPNIKIHSRNRTNHKVDHHFSNKFFCKVVKDFNFISLEDGLKRMYLSIKG